MSRTLVLASTSPYRRMLLERLGLPFEAAAPTDVDERAVDLPPRELVVELARRKALAVARHWPDALVIGSDQVATIDGQALHKPGTIDRACEQLALLSGRTHELLTAVCVVDSRTGAEQSHLDIHELTLRPLDDARIAEYVEREQPLDCAGSYKIEGLGIALMSTIRGEDFTAITGLPLMAVVRMLAAGGLEALAPISA